MSRNMAPYSSLKIIATTKMIFSFFSSGDYLTNKAIAFKQTCVHNEIKLFSNEGV